ncbi:MAG: FAD-binding oxidoreductase [Candidatus Omnitrophota bacterium]
MIVKNKIEEFQSYLEDTSNLKGTASILYLPQEQGEIAPLLQQCAEKHIPFTVSAGRTGTAGGCVPTDGAVISLENLKKIIDINVKDCTVHVQSGVSFEELEKETRKYGLTLRASPTEGLAHIAGAVSTAASGVRGFGYGSIRGYVQEIELVLTSGSVLCIKRADIYARDGYFDFLYKGKHFTFKLPGYSMPRVKSQAGYFVNDAMDLIDLFIGSEGTLGIITSCRLRLQKLPERIFDGLIFFDKEEEAFQFVNLVKKLKDEKLLVPASLEFFDRHALSFLRPDYSFIPQSEAAIYFEQEVERGEDFDSLLDRWAVLIGKSGALSEASILADTPLERARVFSFRHRLPQAINEFLRAHKQVKTATDIAVPWEHFSEMYSFYKEKGLESGLDYVNFGHIGESHLHFNFLPKDDIQGVKARTYLQLFCKKAVSLGGTVSAEHGIGKIKKPYLNIMYTDHQLIEMARVKKYFDPSWLLGLDTIFSKDILGKQP